MNDELISVEAMSDRPHPREVARAAIAAHRAMGTLDLPPLGTASVHDENRADLDHPAKALDVNRAVRSATWEVK